MSTKDLARTAIEGGRRTKVRREGKLRAADRDALGWHAPDGDVLASLALPGRLNTYRAFNDKLSAPLRWLASHVGRPWDHVRSEMFARFDTRTTAGRHIVFDHLLGWVQDGRLGHRCWFKFVVDRHGILRHAASRPQFTFPVAVHPRPDLDAWLARRRVGTRGDVLFWFVPTPAGAYRQDQRLGDEDAARWRALPAWYREQNGPGAPPPDPLRTPSGS